jgi:hypothetical protein
VLSLQYVGIIKAFVSSFNAHKVEKKQLPQPTSDKNSLSPWEDVFERILTASGLPFLKYPRNTPPKPPRPISSLKLDVMVNRLFSNMFDVSGGLLSLEVFATQLSTMQRPYIVCEQAWECKFISSLW